MILSATSLIIALVTSSILALIAMMLVKLISYNKIISSKYLMTICLVFMIRLILPFEFFFTRTLPSYRILPVLRNFLEEKYCILGYLYLRPLELLSILWIIGSLYFGYKFIVRLKKVSGIKKLADSRRNLFSTANQVVFINKPVSPCVVGLFKPTIILPNLPLSESEIELILRHEFLHISSLDLFIKYLYEIISIVYWWNPLVHLFRKHLDLIIELKVDDQVIEQLSTERKFEYLQALINLGKFIDTNPNDTEGLVTSFSGTSHSYLLLRSRNILHTTKKKPKILSMVFVGLFCFVLSSSVIFEPYSVPKDVERTTMRITPDNSYLINIGDGQYELYNEEKLVHVVTEEIRNSEFLELPIRE
ncbi:M56 family metallopeptidase [Enterococcus sp. AZ109]|uniref:M56 family metallopeptidase n=1 Tax=Enterococcus sp. AZ109 TaxID=2774634 RepID=UPI003F22F10B